MDERVSLASASSYIPIFVFHLNSQTNPPRASGVYAQDAVPLHSRKRACVRNGSGVCDAAHTEHTVLVAAVLGLYQSCWRWHHALRLHARSSEGDATAVQWWIICCHLLAIRQEQYPVLPCLVLCNVAQCTRPTPQVFTYFNDVTPQPHVYTLQRSRSQCRGAKVQPLAQQNRSIPEQIATVQMVRHAIDPLT